LEWICGPKNIQSFWKWPLSKKVWPPLVYNIDLDTSNWKTKLHCKSSKIVKFLLMFNCSPSRCEKQINKNLYFKLFYCFFNFNLILGNDPWFMNRCVEKVLAFKVIKWSISNFSVLLIKFRWVEIIVW